MLLNFYAALTQHHWNEHGTRTRDEFLRIYLTRVSERVFDTFRIRHDSMIGVSVLHS